MYRIPRDRVFRAFPELDLFSNAQCERFVQRVRVTSYYRPILWVSLGLLAALTLALVAILLDRFGDRWHRSLWLALNRRWADDLLLAAWILPVAVLPLAGSLPLRDLLLRTYLRRVVRMRLDRVRCRACGYMLIGQQQHDGVVCCPECSSTTTLHALGITAEDLIPPDASMDHLADAPDAAPAT